jgi:integrase
MPVHYDTRNKRWRFRFRRIVAGRAIRTSRLLPAAWTRAEAEAFDRAESARLYGLASGVLKEQPLIDVAVQAYLEAHQDARNILKVESELAGMLEYYEGRTFADLPDVCDRYIADHRETHAPGTIRNRLAYLRAAVRWAWRKKRMGDSDPGAQMVMPAVRNERHHYLQTADVYRLAAACRLPATAAIIRLAFWTGLRWIKELLPRQPADVVRANGVTYLVAGTTKNGAPRMVPVHPDAVADLAHLPFTLHWRTYGRDFEQARTALGMDHIRLHDLRHSLASAIISRGNTLADVGGALGHKSHQSSARYAHLYPERVKKVVFAIKAPAKRKKTGTR